LGEENDFERATDLESEESYYDEEIEPTNVPKK
jgi:hypothetical protein